MNSLQPYVLQRSASSQIVIFLTCFISLICNSTVASDERPEGKIKPITTAEANAFAKLIESRVAKGDTHVLSERFNLEAFKALIFPNTKTQEQDSHDLAKTVSEKTILKLAKNVAWALKKEGRYGFLRARKIKNKMHLLFRMVTADGKLNYHEFSLGRGPDGRLMFEDVYIYLSGELLSSAIKRSLWLMGVASGAGNKQDATSSELDLRKALPDLMKFIQLRQKGQNKEALQAYERLPEKFRLEKNMLLLRVMVAANVNARAYEEALTEIIKYFGNDPGIEFVQIEYFIEKRKFKEALQAVDKLDKQLGGDPYLDFQRCVINFEQGDFQAAKLAGKRLLKAHLESENVLVLLIDISVTQKDYAATLTHLKQIHTEFGTTFEGMQDSDLYKGFTESPFYPQWERFVAKSVKAPSKDLLK